MPKKYHAFVVRSLKRRENPWVPSILFDQRTSSKWSCGNRAMLWTACGQATGFCRDHRVRDSVGKFQSPPVIARKAMYIRPGYGLHGTISIVDFWGSMCGLKAMVCDDGALQAKCKLCLVCLYYEEYIPKCKQKYVDIYCVPVLGTPLATITLSNCGYFDILYRIKTKIRMKYMLSCCTRSSRFV